jgi:hypothetical protein
MSAQSISISLKKNENSQNSEDPQDLIDKAQENLQAMLTSSDFVKLTKVTNINNKEVKRNIRIDVKALLAKLDSNQIKLQELNKLKKIFYLAEDHESEQLLYKAKIDTKVEIIKSLINIRRYYLSQSLKNPEIKNKVVNQMTENLDDINDNLDSGIGNQMGQVEIFAKTDIKDVVNSIEESFTEAIPNLKQEVNCSKSSKKIIEFIKERETKRKQLYNVQMDEEKEESNNEENKSSLNSIQINSNVANEIHSDGQNSSNNSNAKSNQPNSNIHNSFIYTKKEIGKMFKQNILNKNNRNKNVVNQFICTRETLSNDINSLLTRVNSNEAKVNNVISSLKNNAFIDANQAWKAINDNLANFTDIISPIQSFIDLQLEIYKTGSKIDNQTGALMGIINCLAAIINKITNITSTITKLWQYLINERQRSDFNFKLGDKSKKLNANALFKLNKLAGYSNNGQLVQDNEWNKLSKFEKISKRFNFSDINQFPFFKIWKTFSQEEKISFMINRIKNFRHQRCAQLLEEFNNLDFSDKDKCKELGDQINKFIYYANRDRNGNLIQLSKQDKIKVLNELSDIQENYKKNCNNLVNALNELSKINAVIGQIKCRNKFYRCYGKDFSFIIGENNYPKKNNNFGKRKKVFKFSGKKRQRSYNEFNFMSKRFKRKYDRRERGKNNNINNSNNRVEIINTNTSKNEDDYVKEDEYAEDDQDFNNQNF